MEGKDVPPHGDDHLLRHTRGIHLVAHVCADGKRVVPQQESTHKRNLSDRLIEKLRGWYLPVITKSLNWSKALIASMVVLFVASLLIFNRLGGEFIPSLEEGDFAAEISMVQGTSLSQMVESTTQAEKRLKAQFPEVNRR